MKNLLWIVLLSVAICGVCSCRTIRETQTEYVYVNNTDTLTRYKYQRDSIYIHDYIEKWMQGDTVFIKERHIEYRDKENKDTIHWIKTVTITNKLYYTKEKEVEVNRLYWWQKTLMWIGGIGLGLTILLLLVAMLTIRKWIKGK